MSATTILVSYAGYQYTFISLMPDNGLANLAGALLCAGHETLVMDYGTVENVAAMFPQNLVAFAKSAFSSAMETLAAGKALTREHLKHLASLEAKLRQASEIRCRQVAEDVCEQVERLRPDFVGFKLWNGDGFFGSVEIAKSIRSKYKNVKLFAGGPHVDIFRENIYRATDVFDALVYGEGEETVLELAEVALGNRQSKDVANLIFRDDSGAIVTTACKRVSDLNSLPLPCYDEDVYPAMRGNSKIKVIVLDESRGCHFRCHFCIHPFKSGRTVRSKKAGRVAQEMRWVSERTGARAFRYAGSSPPAELAREIGELLSSQRLNVEYAAFGNPLNAVPEYFQILTDSGCRSLAFGMESGCELILRKAMAKPIQLGRMRDVLMASKEAGIFTVVFIIFPAPFETKDTEAQTLAFLREVEPDSAVVLFPAIYPQTRWFTHKEMFGFAFNEMEYLDAVINYKAKTLFPMEFWSDLPYSLSGRSFRSIMNETARFTGILERDGILTSVSDDFALMAALGGYMGNERKLRDLGRLWFFTGDAERIQQFVDAVNLSATSPRLSEAEGREKPGGQYEDTSGEPRQVRRARS